MKSFKDNGFSNSEISEFLNVNGIRPLRTDKPYSPKLVWMSLKKYQNRLDRYDTDTLVELSETLCVTPFTKDNNPMMKLKILVWNWFHSTNLPSFQVSLSHN